MSRLRPRRAILVLCAVVAAEAGKARADGAAAAAPAFVEVVAERPDVFVGEVVDVAVRVGLDATLFPPFPGAVPNGVVSQVRRPLDVPLHVEVPLLRRAVGVVVLPSRQDATGNATVTLALNDAAVPFRREPDAERSGVRLAVFSSRHRVVVEREGDLRAAPATLRAVVATRYRDDLVLGRVPEETRLVVATGAPVAFTARPLPSVGRPAAFSGAVGRFAADAAFVPAEPEEGRLRVRWRVFGPGNLDRVGPLRPPPLPGVHVLGALEAAGDDERTVTLDVTVEPGVTSFPSVPLFAFDPTPPGAYVVVATAPLDLPTPSGPGPGNEGRTARRDAISRWAVGLGIAVIAALLLALAVVARTRAVRRRASRPSPADPRAARRLASVEALGRVAGRGLDASLSDGHAAVVEVVAARLGTAVGAVHAPELATRLRAAGVDAALASETAALLDLLVAARYGGGRDAMAAPADLSARFAASAAAWAREAKGHGP